MEDITIFKTLNNCLGGNFDYSRNDSIFNTSIEGNQLACLYVKNTGLVAKKILRFSVAGIDDISVGMSSVDTIEPILTTGLPPSVSFTNIVNPNIVLEPGMFVTVWLLKDNGAVGIKKEKNTCLNVDWVDV